MGQSDGPVAAIAAWERVAGITELRLGYGLRRGVSSGEGVRKQAQ